ncbi:MAG: proline--tRNA ligase [Culicoidibacterales bacterium]
MRQSLLFVPTLREMPADAETVSHQYLLRGGYVKQNAAGIYTYLPLGLRVLKNVEQIVREELNAIGCSELLMPALQPAELWQESGRWDDYGAEMMRLKDRHDRQFCLGPTHEEVITSVTRDYINSYKKLPLALYQIQTKYRDEQRPRFGLMRGREFVMKDLYTFHANQASLDEMYDKVAQAYQNIFTRCGLNFRKVEADSGAIGGSESAEFMVLSAIGEDTIVYSDTTDFAANIEVIEVAEGEQLPDGSIAKHAKGIEVGHIFKLGTKYSDAMNANFLDENGRKQPVIMGCYGIGVSRVVMAAIEQNHDEAGVVWPSQLAPFDVHVIPVVMKQAAQVEAAMDIYGQLQAAGLNVLVDDRDERAGVKFSDADLVGAPYRIVVGRGIADGLVEVKVRATNEAIEMTIAEAIALVTKA